MTLRVIGARAAEGRGPKSRRSGRAGVPKQLKFAGCNFYFTDYDDIVADSKGRRGEEITETETYSQL